jgi:hypothetical protein
LSDCTAVIADEPGLTVTVGVTGVWLPLPLLPLLPPPPQPLAKTPTTVRKHTAVVRNVLRIPKPPKQAHPLGKCDPCAKRQVPVNLDHHTIVIAHKLVAESTPRS